MMFINVLAVSSHPTVAFAASELERYIAKMSADACDSPVRTIRVGLLCDLLPGRTIPSDAFDDEIAVDVCNGAGIVAGANPRSCLLGVYRLLTLAGCRFLRPGADGELIPAVDWSKVTVRCDEKPSYRHRGVCIEGSVSREIFLNIIDWLPKNGMNAYFMQFREGFTFFDRWYSHQSNPMLPPEPKTLDEVRGIVAEGVEAIRLRGLIYHAVGHGWTCEPFGIPGLGWDSTGELPPGVEQFFAEVEGKRTLWGGVALNTNLCYGNPEARERVASGIADYLLAHPEVDVLHFWLADGANNQCECPLCRDTLPSDFYVDMLNDVDERLTRLGIGTRVVFLIYVDLLWKPQKSKLKNTKRFILMFAPITRTYSKAFAAEGALPEPPPYSRNQLEFPSSVDGNLAHLQKWQELWSADGFVFDYHMMWDHYKDPGYEALAHVLHEDVANLTTIGLNGFVSCQVQSVFFPSPLLMAVLARTLWDKALHFDEIAQDVYLSAYGHDGGRVREYLKNLTALFRPQWLRHEEPLESPEQAKRLGEIRGAVEAFRPVVQANLSDADACRHTSWRLLFLHGDYCALLADFCLNLAQGDHTGAEMAWTALQNWVCAHEMEMHSVFDCNIFQGTISRLF